MKDAEIVWARILDLASAVTAGHAANVDAHLALARMVLEFDRDVVRGPLRGRAGAKDAVPRGAATPVGRPTPVRGVLSSTPPEHGVGSPAEFSAHSVPGRGNEPRS
jgi:hypothetical protein